MGRRIGFVINPSGKGLKELILENYQELRKHTLDFNNECMGNFEGRTISNDLEEFLTDRLALNDIQDVSQAIADELTSCFYFDYCEIGPGRNLLKLIDPLASTFNYIPSFEASKGFKDKELARLWKFLEKGRSIKNNKEYIRPESYDEWVHFFGFWEKHEIQQLKTSLKRIIPALKKSENNFVNYFKQKIGFTYIPPSYGFELALTALEELESDQEVILTIEY